MPLKGPVLNSAAIVECTAEARVNSNKLFVYFTFTDQPGDVSNLLFVSRAMELLRSRSGKWKTKGPHPVTRAVCYLKRFLACTAF